MVKQYLVESLGLSDAIYLLDGKERRELRPDEKVVLAGECEAALAEERGQPPNKVLYLVDADPKERAKLIELLDHGRPHKLMAIPQLEEVIALRARVRTLELCTEGLVRSAQEYIRDLERDGYEDTDAGRAALAALHLAKVTLNP